MKKVCVITGGGMGLATAKFIDERLGFLTGTDIIMDGGVIASGASGLSRYHRSKNLTYEQ